MADCEALKSGCYICTAARMEWGFAPKYDLAAMTTDMLARLREKLG